MCWKRFVICICRFPALLFLLLWLPVPKPRRFFPTHLISKSDIFEPGLFAWEPLGMNLVLPSGNSTSWGTKSITHLLLLFFLIKGWLRQKITMMSPNLLRRSENFHLLQLAFTDLWWFAVPRKATRTALNNGQYNGEGRAPPPTPSKPPPKNLAVCQVTKTIIFFFAPPRRLFGHSQGQGPVNVHVNLPGFHADLSLQIEPFLKVFELFVCGTRNL